MIELKEPICKGFYKFNYDEAFSKISAYFEHYQIKKIDKEFGEIIVEASYLFTLFLWSTWIKHIVIKIERRSENLTMIDIYGKPVLSPHHLFKTLYYRKIKIDINKFKEDFIKTFQKYEWHDK